MYAQLQDKVIQSLINMETYIEDMPTPKDPADIRAWKAMWKAISGFKDRMFALGNSVDVDDSDQEDEEDKGDEDGGEVDEDSDEDDNYSPEDKKLIKAINRASHILNTAAESPTTPKQLVYALVAAPKLKHAPEEDKALCRLVAGYKDASEADWVRTRVPLMYVLCMLCIPADYGGICFCSCLDSMDWTL